MKDGCFLQKLEEDSNVYKETLDIRLLSFKSFG